MLRRKVFNNIVRNVLNEAGPDYSHDKVVEKDYYFKLKITGRSSPGMQDVLTDIRAIPGVVTAKQTIPLVKKPGGVTYAKVAIAYLPDDTVNDNYIKKETSKINGVSIVVLKDDNST